MKLTDLEPRWLTENLFVFRCPHCQKTWLSCKDVPLTHKEQFGIFRTANLDPHGPHYAVVPMEPNTCWQISGKDFSNMTVAPSIHAGNSGHWHGYIRNGEIITV